MRIIKLCRYLVEVHKEFTLSRELLSSGTSIGKFVALAVGGESRESFILNMAKAQKADETEYWLKLIHFAEYIINKEYDSIETDRKELARMLNKYRQDLKR